MEGLPLLSSSYKNYTRFHLASYFAAAFAFITEGRASGGVLVHWFVQVFALITVFSSAGVSRSATIVIGYVMHTIGLNNSDALRYVQGIRSIVEPNSGFQRQLAEYYTFRTKIFHEEEIKNQVVYWTVINTGK